MKASSHVLNTWVLAHLLHPFVFYFYFLYLNKESLEFQALLSLFVGAFFVSLPSLIASLFFIRLVLWLPFRVVASFGSWLVLTLGSIFLNIILLGLLLGDNLINRSDQDFFIPSFIATFLSVLLRYPALKKIIYQNKQTKNEQEIANSYGTWE